MKKWITALAAILLLSCPMTAFAAEVEVDEVPEGETGTEQGIEVYGSCQSSKDYYEITLGVPGMDSVDLPDDVTLSGKSDSAEDNGLRVVIIPVTAEEEADAYAWLSGVTSKLGKEPAAYYLAFYDEDETAQPEGKVTVTMTTKDGYEKAKFCYMDGNAVTKDVSYTTGEKNISFGMEKTGYYLFVKTGGSSQPTEPTNPDDQSKPVEPAGPSKPAGPDKPGDPADPDAPKTGDSSHLGVYLALLVLSGTALAALAVVRRKKKEKTDGQGV